MLGTVFVSANPRQLAFITLRAIQRGAFADVALDQTIQRSPLNPLDKRLLTELVYGTIRQQRTLDALIDQFGKKNSQQQPPDLRLILHLGLYQLRYLSHVPPSAAVNTTVELAKDNGFAGLAGVVNGILRQYERSRQREDSAEFIDPLRLPPEAIARLGILHSYPDWIVAVWLEQFGELATDQLCQWLNQAPAIDLRVNPLRSSLAQVEAALNAVEIETQRLPWLPQALRLVNPVGDITRLPGFQEGWWMVQDGSAQLVSQVLDPQPGETVIDACAAPGGKTTHIAELMGDRGTVWACDKTPSRLKKVQQNCDRLGLHSIKIQVGDSRHQPQWAQQGDRVLVDAPCSGLGTLHRHADARWRQTPASVATLSQLQQEILSQAATWVKPTGRLVYATCTLHPAENEQIIEQFLTTHPAWSLVPLPAHLPYTTPFGWGKVLPHEHNLDGFFIAQLAPHFD